MFSFFKLHIRFGGRHFASLTPWALRGCAGNPAPLRGVLTPGVALTTHLSVLIYQRRAELTPLSDLLNFLKDPLQVVKHA